MHPLCCVCLVTWHLVHRHVHRQDGSLCGLICTYIHDTYMTHTHVYMDTTLHNTHTKQTHVKAPCVGTTQNIKHTHTKHSVRQNTHNTPCHLHQCLLADQVRTLVVISTGGLMEGTTPALQQLTLLILQRRELRGGELPVVNCSDQN